jgi:hypothetical protein
MFYFKTSFTYSHLASDISLSDETRHWEARSILNYLSTEADEGSVSRDTFFHSFVQVLLGVSQAHVVEPT